MADDTENKSISRRNFLKKSGYVASGVVGGGVIGSLLGLNFDLGDESATTSGQDESSKFHRALMYFTDQHEFETLAEATERIFPEDDNGAGAIALAVPYFIDHQLAGSYGNNTQEYMQGPFKEGSSYQGYQSRLKRNEIFTQGVRKIDEQSKEAHDDSFINLEDDQKDDILSKFEENEVDMKAVEASDFFQLLVQSTLNGAYADPLYGGNEDMEGWKMKEYPGNKMSYIDEIEEEGFKEMEPDALNEHLSI